MNAKRRSTLILFCLTSSLFIACPPSLRADEPAQQTLAQQTNAPRIKEPVYQGRTLTSWLQDFYFGSPWSYGNGFLDRKIAWEKHRAAEWAVRAMGTEALPVLLDRLTIASGTLDFGQAARTSMAFRALGFQACPAIPALIQLLAPAYEAAHQSLSEPDAHLKDSQANAAASILRAMSEASTPPLIEALGSKDPKIRFGAAMALGDFHKQGKNIVPSLIKALDDEDKNVRWRAARSLGDLRQMPELAVAALAKRVHDDPAGNVRSYAIMALGKFEADALTALPELNEATNDPEPFIALYAQEALGKIKKAAAQKVVSP